MKSDIAALSAHLLALLLFVEGVHAAPQWNIADLVGEWESAACETKPPINATTGVGSGWWKRKFTITQDSGNLVWNGTFQDYSTSTCDTATTAYITPPPAPKLAISEGSFDGARNADFYMPALWGGGYERDVAVRLGPNLYFGARPLDGSDLKSDEKRPLSLAPALRLKTGATPPAVLRPTLTDIEGRWRGGCEVAAGNPNAASYTREFSIYATGHWEGTFSFFSDAACSNQVFVFPVEKSALTITGNSPNVAYAVNAEFTFPAAAGGGHESDIISLSGGKLLLGARPLDGSDLRGDHKRPVSFAPPLSRIAAEPPSTCDAQIAIVDQYLTTAFLQQNPVEAGANFTTSDEAFRFEWSSTTASLESIGFKQVYEGKNALVEFFSSALSTIDASTFAFADIFPVGAPTLLPGVNIITLAKSCDVPNLPDVVVKQWAEDSSGGKAVKPVHEATNTVVYTFNAAGTKIQRVQVFVETYKYLEAFGLPHPAKKCAPTSANTPASASDDNDKVPTVSDDDDKVPRANSVQVTTLIFVACLLIMEMFHFALLIKVRTSQQEPAATAMMNPARKSVLEMGGSA